MRKKWKLFLRRWRFSLRDLFWLVLTVALLVIVWVDNAEYRKQLDAIRAEANHDLVIVAEKLLEQSDYSIIVSSYLELAEPSIPTGVRQCVEAGADHVLMMPYFLSAGSHVTRDLERFRKEAADEFVDVKFDLCPPLGLHPLMLEIIKSRLQEAGNA